MSADSPSANKLWFAKGMYLVMCFSQAAILNFLPVFYQLEGFSKAQIGILQSLPAITVIGGAPFWGAVADKTQQSRAVTIFAIISACLVLYCMQFLHSFYVMFLVGFIGFFQTAPIGPLLDQSVLQLLKQVGGEYGRQRLFGGIGYGLGAYVTGEIVALWNINWAFNIHVISAFASLIVLHYLPVGKAAKSAGGSMAAGFAQLREKPDVLCLFFLVLLMGLMFGVISSFLTLYLFNLAGGDARIVGIAIACETASEIPAFFFADKVLAKLGTSGVLLVSIIGYALRITSYALISNPYYALPFECLHGVTFSLSWAACTNYVFRAANPGTDGTMMGLLSSMLQGYGRTFGTLFGGWLYNSYGAVTMWWVTDLGIPIALAGLFVFHKLSSSINRPTTPANESKVDEVGMLSPGANVPVATFEEADGEDAERAPLVGENKL